MRFLRSFQISFLLLISLANYLNADQCLSEAVNTYGTNTFIKIGDYSDITTPTNLLPTDNPITLSSVVANAHNSCITDINTTDCNASGTPFSFTSFMKTQNVTIPTIDQTFSNTFGNTEDITTDTNLFSSLNYDSFKVRIYSQVSLKTTQDPLQITNMLIDDTNSSLYITSTNPFNLEVENGTMGASTYLTLDNAQYFKTKIFTQGSDSSITLNNVNEIDAGSWNIAGGSCSKVSGTTAYYKFKGGIDGTSRSASSIILEGVDTLYSKKIGGNFIYINANNISINDTFILEQDGNMSIDTTDTSEVNLTVGGKTTFQANTQVCLAAGDYYFEDLELGSGVHIDPLGDGTVRIFINGNFSDASTGLGSYINQGGDPSQMLIYAKNSMTINAKSDISGLIISDGSITMGSTNSEIHGAMIVKDTFDLKAYNHVIYDQYVNTINSNDANFTCSASYTAGTYSISGRCDFANHVSHSCPTVVENTSLPSTSYVSGLFDAWDTDKDISDRNISTKIVNKDFNLTIASINDTNDAIETKPGIDIEYYLKDMIQENNISSNASFDVNDTSEINASYSNIQSAYKDVKVIFKVCATYDGSTYGGYPFANCSSDCSSNDYQTTKIPCYRHFESSDNFALRPKIFSISNVPNMIRSGNEFNLTLKALDYNDNPTQDYNDSIQVKGVSASLEYEDNNSNCFTGDLSLTSAVNFANGEANVTLQYTEVGDVNLSLEDSNGSEFAKEDDDDTSDTDRFISTATTTLHALPDHFAVDAVFSNYDDNNFTYISDNLFMSATLDMNITAQNTEDGTTQNYNSQCYAQNIDANISYTINNEVNPRTVFYKETNTTDFNATSITFNDLNSSYFTVDNNGTATLHVTLNFDRNISNNLNPFSMVITDMNISDVNDTQGYTLLNQNAIFVYGRTHATRQQIEGNNGDVPINFEVYCNGTDSFGTDCNKTLLPSAASYSDDPRWLINTLHATATDGNVTEDTQKNGTGTVTETNIVANNPTISTLNYDESKGYPYKTTIQTTPSSWLIYNKYDENAATNEFEVEFLDSGDWAGAHETNTTTNTNAPIRTNRRTMW